MTDQTQEDSDQQPLYRQQAYQQRGRVAPIDGILRVSAPRRHRRIVRGRPIAPPAASA